MSAVYWLPAGPQAPVARVALSKIVDCFAGVLVDVERWVGQSARRCVDDCPDRDRHRLGIEVGPEIAGSLEASEQVGEDVDGPVAVATEWALGAGDRRAHDLDDGLELVGVVAHELEVGLDVGAQHRRAGCLRLDARLHVRPRASEHLADDLGDQVVLAGEVVADHTLADAEPYADARQRRVRVPDLRYRVDRSVNDLRPPGATDERATVTRSV